MICRTPQGVRGLKWKKWSVWTTENMSHPARGAWIEILFDARKLVIKASHPARGAWIEMTKASSGPLPAAVAPRKGCVD